jgi:hypothetical protein
MRRSLFLRSVLAGAVALGMALTAGVADTRDTLDPIVLDVVRMLEGGVAADVVAAWLEKSGSHPAKVGPDELIALAKAGASDALTRRLVALASVEPTTSGSARLDLTVDYWSNQQDNPDRPWDLYVYLDGRPVAAARPKASIFDKAARFTIEIAPGRHVMRILRERHTLLSKKKGTWSHEADVCPEPIDLDVPPADALRLALEVDTGAGWSWKKKGPLTWKLLRGETTIDQKTKVGFPVADWPLLCEEIESRLEPGRKVPSWVKKDLDRCTRWSSLWPDTAAIQDRTAVRAEMIERGMILSP